MSIFPFALRVKKYSKNIDNRTALLSKLKLSFSDYFNHSVSVEFNYFL